jgi:carbon monoxide dehydrogenase subunit G
MARFESRNVSHATVPAPREDIWAIVTSPEALAELTPLIDRITADGDRWCWQLKRISALGVHVEPSFTEHMTFEDGRRMTFEHQAPPGKSEVAGAKGVYSLAERADGGTDLSVDITIHVELPLPAFSRRAVQRVMASMMARTGDKFAENLYARLGITPGDAAKLKRVGA